jgi:DNA-binding transcriptional MerR regulator
VAERLLTISGVALRLKVAPWKVSRLFEAGALPEPARLANYRVFTEADIPAIRAALERAGWLEPAKAGK